MFRTITTINGMTQAVAVRFGREDAIKTTCELKIGGINTPAKHMKLVYNGVSVRNPVDKFDKGRGHLIALKRALGKSGIDKAARLDVYMAYVEWAIKNHLRTQVPLNRIIGE